MGAPKKKLPHYTPAEKAATSSAEQLRLHKVEAERLREHLQKRILDNPDAAKKAAKLISLWINSEKKKSQKDKE